MRIAGAVALATLLLYLPSLAGPFHFDDYNVIVHYPTVHSWGTLFERASGGVRALLKASYTLNWTIDEGAFGFHLVNIALHALNAVLLFLIGRNLFPRHASAALVAALLFAFHPAQTEAVTYISGRSSSLMATFYLCSLLVYLRGGHWVWSGLLFVLAVATRETAVTLPAALLLIELSRSTPWRDIARRQAPHWLLLAGAGLFVIANQRYFDLLAYGYGERSFADNLLTQIGGVGYLLSRLVGLQGLNIDPALPTLTEWTPLLLLQAALLLSLLAFGLANLRARPWIGFGVLWFFLQLAPTNSIVPRLDVANDRQLYLASWGLFFALSIQVAQLEPPRWLARSAAASLFIVFAAFNLDRQLDYLDEVTLWEASVRQSPWNARAHNNLGYAYYEAGRKRDALREIDTALLLDPKNQKARANLVLLDWK
jgi:hypothetical protein